MNFLEGKVWLVGAGPGDVELLTVKGRRLLEQADTVVYDHLIGSGVLGYASPEAELIDVGKSGGHHLIPQEEIERILIEKALEGKRVVRLKGGDPFLFGRGGEEMEALMSREIPCEPVPGVTSALAVPAFAGIPVTHRDYASSLHIITAHKRGGAPINYDILARLEGTLVFLMGASKLGEICRRLTEAGMNESTPVAVVEWGTTARQRRVTGVLADLADLMDRVKSEFASPSIRSPALLVVGRVVTLAEALDWRARLPLGGKRVLVCQASQGNKNGRLTALLRSRGAEVLEACPSRMEATLDSLPALSGYGWFVFTSTAGVEFFFERLKRDRRDIREIGDAKIAAVGPATKDAIESHGLRVDLIPPLYSGAALGESLLREYQSSRQTPPQRLLLLQALNSAPDLARILRNGGLSFDEMPLYQTLPAISRADLGDVDAVAFTCASSVLNFAALCPDARVKAVCIGEQTGKTAREAGYEVKVAKKATLEDLADAVEILLSGDCSMSLTYSPS
ncbi:MAG: uroporphyrinogen-III C-methyltransferase [Synergistaceae bacterium]|nr:uroporphyrinogen-III C-methyltransferase [Synergistaceae bacterium]